MMLGSLTMFVVGGFAGGVTLALIMAVRERPEQWQRTDGTRTASHAYEPGSWAIADNGAITTESQLGTFTMAKRPARYHEAPSRRINLVLPPKQ